MKSVILFIGESKDNIFPIFFLKWEGKQSRCQETVEIQTELKKG
jgi:hypothetical protein